MAGGSQSIFCVAILGLGVLQGCAQQAFFQPDRIDRGTPADGGLAYRESDFRSEDGTRLTGWFLPARTVTDPRQAQATVIHFHGNAQNMGAHWHLVAWLCERGFNVFTFDYRGYGRSGGTPSVAGLAADSRSALAHVRALPDVNSERLCVLGQSLGGANAIVAVAQDGGAGVKAIAIESTFASYSSIAEEKLSFVGSLMQDEFAPEPFVARLSPVPILFIHGTGDRVIAPSHSERLYEAAQEPKRLILVPGAGHLDVFRGEQRETERSALVAFYREALGSS